LLVVSTESNSVTCASCWDFYIGILPTGVGRFTEADSGYMRTAAHRKEWTPSTEFILDSTRITYVAPQYDPHPTGRRAALPFRIIG